MFVEEIRVQGNIANYTQIGNAYYVALNSIGKNQQKEAEISVSYRNCTSQGISTILVSMAHACEAITPANFSEFACGASTVLELENMVAVLSATETYSNEAVELCEDIPVFVTIDNIGRADLTELGLWFENFPENYTLTDNAINWSYNGENGKIINNNDVNNPLAVNLFSQNTGISRQIISIENDQKAPLTATAPTITIDFNVQVHCGGSIVASNFNSTPDLLFNIKGLTNCRAEQERKFIYMPKIKGFEYLDSIRVHATAGAFTEYKGNADFYAAVTNISSKLVDSAYISVLIPQGVLLETYSAQTPNSITGVQQIPQTNGETLLQWELEQGVHLAAGETIGVNYTLRATADCPTTAKILVMGTLKRIKKDCNNVECTFSQSTAAYELEINPIELPFSATISSVPSACVGTPASYSVQGTGITSVLWNLEPASIGTLTHNDATATVHYTQSGKADITAEVCGMCKCSTLVASTNVQIAPTISMPDSITITYDDWLSQGTDAIQVAPAGGSFSSAKPVQNCGTYTYSYTLSNACDTVEQDIVITIINCCPPPLKRGDIAITDREGVTTFDVEILKYYIAHPEKLQYVGEYELYTIEYEFCEGNKTIELVPCFKKWADINGDGKIDKADVEALMKLIK